MPELRAPKKPLYKASGVTNLNSLFSPNAKFLTTGSNISCKYSSEPSLIISPIYILAVGFFISFANA